MMYAIETLKIEKYKLINLKRQLFIMQLEAQTSLMNEINATCDKLKQLDWAIAELEREQVKGFEAGKVEQ